MADQFLYRIVEKSETSQMAPTRPGWGSLDYFKQRRTRPSDQTGVA